MVFLAWSSRHPFHFRVCTQGSEGLNCSRPGTSSGHPIRVARTQGDHSGHMGRGQQNLSSDWDGGAVQRPLKQEDLHPSSRAHLPPTAHMLGAHRLGKALAIGQPPAGTFPFQSPPGHTCCHVGLGEIPPNIRSFLLSSGMNTMRT